MNEAIWRILEAAQTRGLSLQEWASQSYERAGISAHIESSSPREELDEWRAHLEELGLWKERLQSLSLTPDRFASFGSPAVAPPAAHVAEQLEPFLRDIFARFADNAPPRTRRYGEGLPPLPAALEAHVDDGMRASAAAAVGLADDTCLRVLAQEEATNLLHELYELLLPAVVTELHVASTRRRLSGDTPEARFASYCDRVAGSPEWLFDFFMNYPVAVRLVMHTVATRRAAFRELLERLAADLPELVARGFTRTSSLPQLRSISPVLGDRHRGGQAVRMIELSDGTRLVYKPRSSAIDVAFQQMVQWLNGKGFQPPLYVMDILDRGDYGWCPYVAAADCPDRDAVGRFYRRHGAHVALLYLLGGYDFFRSNVRATGEYPVLVDLECVHAPRMPAFNGRLFDSAARRYLEESVLRAGLLPAWNWVYMGDGGVDLSALTLKEGQNSPQDVPVWTDRGTDRLRQVRERHLMDSDHANLSTLDGVPVPVDDYTTQLFDGFREAYDLIGEYRMELLGPASPLAGFAGAECRLVLRNTLDYQTILRELRHPRYLSSGVRHSRLLDRLWASRCPRYSVEVLEAEIEQLWGGDVPIFTTTGASRDVWTGASRIQSDYLEESAQEGALRRLQRWGPEDRERQLTIMNSAFAITELPHVGDQTLLMPLNRPADGEERLPPNDELLRESGHIADRILELSIEDESTLTWIGLGVNRAGQWDQMSLDSGLYDGGPGIALFLLMHDVANGSTKYRSAYDKIIRYVCDSGARQVLDSRARLRDWIIYPPTAFLFPFSGLYLSLIASAHGRPADVEAILDAALAWGFVGLEKRPRFDFLNGAAGVARVLMLAHDLTGDPRPLRLACAYADQLLANATTTSQGMAWASEQFPAPLGGFSHGTAGIAWVLAELGNRTGDAEYLRVASAALEYDRALFNADREEWYDLRFGDSEPGSAVQWCHGVAGIGLVLRQRDCEA